MSDTNTQEMIAKYAVIDWDKNPLRIKLYNERPKIFPAFDALYQDVIISKDKWTTTITGKRIQFVTDYGNGLNYDKIENSEFEWRKNWFGRYKRMLKKNEHWFELIEKTTVNIFLTIDNVIIIR
jgi:hypothetical protein